MPGVKVQRAESLRSERSDASLANKRVSFNNDVDVKHIQLGRHGNRLPTGHVHKEPTALSESQLAEEAERIIQQVDQISCIVSPNPAAASIASGYDTRSLERHPRRSHRSPEASARSARRSPERNHSPEASARGFHRSPERNHSPERFGRGYRRSPERNHSPELDSGRKLDPILESQLSRDSYVAQDIRTSPVTTVVKDTPKYDSGIEMEFQNQQLPAQRMGYESLPEGERPPLTRHNVNLIVQQLTEEARMRERMRKKLELEGLDAMDGGPRLPALNVVEPNAEFGLSHNKNLPFSYTGGSPIRTSPGRFPSPPRKISSDSQPESLPAAPRNDIVYATVVRDPADAGRMQRQTSNGSSDKSRSGRVNYQHQVSNGSGDKIPAARNSYQRQPSNGSSDKIPAGRNSYQRQPSNEMHNEEVDIIPIIRQHLRPDGQDDPLQAPEEMDYRKARFLFGDDGTGSKSFRRQEKKIHNPQSSTDPEESSSPDQRTYPSYRRNIRHNNNINSSSNNVNNNHIINNNNNNNNHIRSQIRSGRKSEAPPVDSTAAPSGLTHKYTTLLKDRSVSPDRNYTTKILIGTDADIRRERVFQYSDDDDVGRYHIRQDRSVSPEVRPLRQQQQQQQQQQQRSRNSDSSPEAIERKQLSSTRLIQEAERGRNVGIRRPQTINSSRLVQQAYREDSIQEPPVAPIRTKKLRERMETSPPRAERSGMRVGFNANVDSIPPWKQQQQQQQRWKHRKNSESSRERSSSPRRPDDFHAEFHDGPEGYVYAPRYHPASVDPRFARRYHPEEEEEAEMDNVRLGPDDVLHIRRYGGHPARVTQESTDTTRRMSVSSDEKRNDKRLRQRNKFLSVFLGPKKKTKDNDKVKGQGQTKTQSKTLKSLSEGSKIAKWQPMIPVPASTLQRSETMASTRNNKTQTTPTPTQTAPAPTTLPAAARRRSPPQRTDTSGSEEMAHHQRFSQLRQKSQSFSNLNYRHGPAGSERQRQAEDAGDAGDAGDAEDAEDDDVRNWASLDDSAMRRNRRPHPLGKESNVVYADARPYASTNVIHRTPTQRNDTEILSQQDRHRQRQTAAAPVTSQPRGMRFFGDTDAESLQSSRYRYAPKTKVVHRSASNAAAMTSARRGLPQQQQQPRLRQPNGSHPHGLQKHPGSVNSTESDGSNMQSGASADSQRSVYLHATTVADIPTATVVNTKQQQRMRAMSREDVSKMSPSLLSSAASPASSQTGSTLRRSRQISRSYSVLAPWKPRHYREKYEITYSNKQQETPEATPAPPATADVVGGKPPRAPLRRYRDENDSPKATNAVTRSSTIPKNTKMAGWFRSRKKKR